MQKAHQLAPLAGRGEVAGYENPSGFCSVGGSNWRGLRTVIWRVVGRPPFWGGGATARSAIFKPGLSLRVGNQCPWCGI
jgi:hypothetical protein